MSNAPKALIIGCGLAGPVAATALTRAGYQVTIYEARTTGAEAGAFLNLASNGLAALRALSMEGAVVNEGFPTPTMTMWGASGKKLGDVANGMTLADGTSSLTIRRAALHRGLRREAERAGIPVVEGSRLLDAATGPDGTVVARFEDGSEVQGDLLIGADGLWSRTRELIDASAPAPRYNGMLSVGGFATVPALEPTPGTFHMVFGRRAFFGYSVRSSREVFWFANLAQETEPGRGQLASIPTDAWRDKLLDLFAGDYGPMISILAASDTIVPHPVHDMPAVRRWHRGRLVLVGDAAHATSPSAGQGASMAFEDAVVLGACLRGRGGSEIEGALASYQERRRGRVERVARYSAQVGNAKVLGPVGRWLRDAMMPFALKHFASPTAHQWLYAHPLGEEMGPRA